MKRLVQFVVVAVLLLVIPFVFGGIAAWIGEFRFGDKEPMMWLLLGMVIGVGLDVVIVLILIGLVARHWSSK